MLFSDTATTEIYTLSLHDALPIAARLLDPDGPGLSVDPVGHRIRDPAAVLVQRPSPAQGHQVPHRSWRQPPEGAPGDRDRKSTRLNSSNANISYAVSCLKTTIRST